VGIENVYTPAPLMTGFTTCSCLIGFSTSLSMALAVVALFQNPALAAGDTRIQTAWISKK